MKSWLPITNGHRNQSGVIGNGTLRISMALHKEIPDRRKQLVNCA